MVANVGWEVGDGLYINAIKSLYMPHRGGLCYNGIDVTCQMLYDRQLVVRINRQIRPTKNRWTNPVSLQRRS